MDRIRSIVVPTDFSPLSEAAAARAAVLARIDGAAIHLVHAVHFPLVAEPYEVSVPAAVWQGVRRAAGEKLEAARKALEASGPYTVTAEIPDSPDEAHAIAAVVEEHAADLVVMGTHGHGGLKHAFLGSVAERTLRTVDRPILVVKEDAERAAQPITRIVLAVDFSETSDSAVDAAAALADRLHASVDVIHAFDLPYDYVPYASPFGVELEQQIQASTAERLAAVRERLEALGVPVTVDARRGHPSVVIAEKAEETGCQLIVMGTHGHTGLSHVLLGSVAERTLRAAPCSVLTVKRRSPKS